ncbi:MAG: dicarboxylate/amino acid:cation symporter [Thermoguttaceae bacterium]|nr:dicarboxylate/amino acid:cation symporter [Thermoguttaceae bacterium]
MRFRVPLLFRVLIAVALGIVLGLFLPGWAVRIFATIQMIFAQYLGFCIPLIILGLIVSGISGLGIHSGKILLLTICLAYGSTLFSGFMTYFSCTGIFPWLLKDLSVVAPPEASDLIRTPYFVMEIPPVMGVMSALVLAFVLGIGIAKTGSATLKQFADEFRFIIERLIIKTIIPFLPLFILCIFMGMTAEGTIWKMLNVFGKIILVVFDLHFGLLAIQFIAAGLVARKNPLKAFWNMLPAYFTALGTSSSAATIPVTLQQVRKNGVDPEVADFCVPLCATIHLAGSTLKITAFALAIAILTGGDSSLPTFAAFIALLGVTMIAAPGVPGGAIMAATAILQSVLGFDEVATGLMIALYITTDCFGTACNVCGDGAIALVVNRFNKKLTDPSLNTQEQ